MTTTRIIRTLFTLLLTGLFGGLVVGVGAGPAQAADIYRYWAYFHVENDKYAFAETGPAEFTPEDGSVEAYRYGAPEGSDPLFPRADLSTLDFDTVCEGVQPEAGQKRVAVLLDSGVKADAEGEDVPEPVGDCVVIPEDANGQQVLDEVGDLRLEDGLICGIGGYPTQGCGGIVDTGTPANAAAVEFVLADAPETEASASDGGASGSSPESGESTADDNGTNMVWLVAIGALVVVIAAAAFVLSRRRTSR